MSRDKAKGIFKAAETKWTEETMHEYTDVVYNDMADKSYVNSKFNQLFGKNTKITTLKVDETTNSNGTVIGLRNVSNPNVSMCSVAGIGVNSTVDYIGVSVYPRWRPVEERIELYFTQNGSPMTNKRVIVWLTVIEFEE